MNKNQEKKDNNKGNVVVKKTKGKKKGNPELLRRLEHLQNISQLMSTLGVTTLSSFYGTSMKTLGKKCVYRIDPKVKRNFCRKCATAFTPNKTCDVEIIHPKKEFSYVNCICRTCGVTRKYILNPDHKLWDTNPEFIKDIYQKLEKRPGVATKSSVNE